MNSYYESESFFLRWFGKLADAVLLSLLWAVCCLPVVTIGASTIALYDSVAQCLHGKKESPFKYFFHVLKAELLRGILITLVWAVLGFGLYLGYCFLRQWAQTSQLANVYSMVYLGTLLIPVGIFIWLIPMEARFSYGFLGLHKAAATFALVYLPTTGILLGITAVAAVMVMLMPALVIVLPGILVTLQSWFIEKIFIKHIDGDAPSEEEERE